MSVVVRLWVEADVHTTTQPSLHSLCLALFSFLSLFPHMCVYRFICFLLLPLKGGFSPSSHCPSLNIFSFCCLSFSIACLLYWSIFHRYISQMLWDSVCLCVCGLFSLPEVLWLWVCAGGLRESHILINSAVWVLDSCCLFLSDFWRVKVLRCISGSALCSLSFFCCPAPRTYCLCTKLYPSSLAAGGMWNKNYE